MKKLSVIAVALAAILATSIGFAASDRQVTASFDAIAASGVSGQAKLAAMPPGGTSFHGTIEGLQPGVEYVSIYYINGTCAPEANSAGQVIERFTANPQGKATFQNKLNVDLETIHSVSVQLASSLAVQACASVNF